MYEKENLTNYFFACDVWKSSGNLFCLQMGCVLSIIAIRLERNMLRRRTLVAGVITLLFLLFSNSLWLVKKPVDLEFNLEGVDTVKISYKLSSGIFNSKIVSKNFDLINSSKIKISTDKLFFNKAEIVVDTAFRGGGTL